MIDKKQLREVKQAYQVWNEWKLEEMAKQAAERSPAESFRSYVSLWQFTFGRNPGVVGLIRDQHAVEMTAYYEHLNRFEAWRLNHGTQLGTRSAPGSQVS